MIDLKSMGTKVLVLFFVLQNKNVKKERKIKGYVYFKNRGKL